MAIFLFCLEDERAWRQGRRNIDSQFMENPVVEGKEFWCLELMGPMWRWQLSLATDNDPGECQDGMNPWGDVEEFGANLGERTQLCNKIWMKMS